MRHLLEEAFQRMVESNEGTSGKQMSARQRENTESCRDFHEEEAENSEYAAKNAETEQERSRHAATAAAHKKAHELFSAAAKSGQVSHYRKAMTHAKKTGVYEDPRDM